MSKSSTPLPEISWNEASARRLERNGLAFPLLDTSPAGVAEVMCGVHAQIISAAVQSVGLRVAGITQADIERELWEEYSLIKTYGPRGTVHLLSAQDLPMWIGALSATPYGQTRDPGQKLLTTEQSEMLIEAIAANLLEGELTTDELTQALVDRVGSWAGDPVMPAFQGMWPRWRAIQSTAGMRGALCFGPNRGRNVTFTNPRRWLPDFRPMDEQNALAELVQRFLYAYGPATPQQFAQWFAVPRTWAADLFASLSNKIEQVSLEGSPAWVAAGDTDMTASPIQSALLLPYFDAYTIAGFPRELLFPGKAGERALNRGQAGNYPVLLINGIVSGVWQMRRSGRKIDITVEALDGLTREKCKTLDEQVERIGEIFDGKAQWSTGTVTTGPHA